MGDPKKFRKKYATPNHPWNGPRIEEERVWVSDYALKNKKEIYKIQAFLKKYKNIAKRLNADKSEQGQKEAAQVLSKLHLLGLLPVDPQLNMILNIQEKDVLERRLQSLVCRKGYARSMKQARQFIVHRHISIGGKEVTSPAYLVTVEDESKVEFKPKSALASEEHPERAASAVKEEVAHVIEETAGTAEVVAESVTEEAKEEVAAE